MWNATRSAARCDHVEIGQQNVKSCRATSHLYYLKMEKCDYRLSQLHFNEANTPLRWGRGTQRSVCADELHNTPLLTSERVCWLHSSSFPRASLSRCFGAPPVMAAAVVRCHLMCRSFVWRLNMFLKNRLSFQRCRVQPVKLTASFSASETKELDFKDRWTQRRRASLQTLTRATELVIFGPSAGTC